MASITVKNFSLKLIKYENRANSLKESFIRYILNFGKSSYGQEDFWVLNDVNFELISGDRLAIIGINGSGKSTLLKALVGIYPATKGSINIKGSYASLIEMGVGLDPELTGRENIMLSGVLLGLPKQAVAARVEDIIDFSGIREFIDTPIKYYSTGMGMRLSFSIATNVNAEILIVDELLAGGDISFIDKATQRIESLIKNANIFVTCSHNVKYVNKICNKILYIKDRQMAYFGSDIKGCLKQYESDSLS